MVSSALLLRKLRELALFILKHMISSDRSAVTFDPQHQFILEPK